MGHLGSRVSALLDGQLGPREAERCWQHVHACHACRDLVEREGWVKARLSGLGSPAAGTRFGGPAGTPGAARPARGGASPPGGRARPMVLTLGGAGAGALVLGVALLALGPGGDPGDLAPPASSLRDGAAGAREGIARPQPVLPGHRFVPADSTAP